MFNSYFENLKKHEEKIQKENYIADMLVHTLYSNDVTNEECYNIIKKFEKKVLGYVEN